MFLHTVQPELECFKTSILGGTTIPSLSDTCQRMLCASTSTIPLEPVGDQSALNVHSTPPIRGKGKGSSSRGGHGSGCGRGRRFYHSKCSHYRKMGYLRDTCYALHGFPPRHSLHSTNAIQSQEGLLGS